MKIFTILFLLVFILLGSTEFNYAQKVDLEKKWSVVSVEPNTLKKAKNKFDWTPVNPEIKFYNVLNGATVYPNFRPHPTTNSTQSEMSIDVHPSNENIIFASANSTDWPVTTLYGTGVYWSLSGGATWTSYDDPPFGINSGDPASVIGTDGRFYENYISISGGQGVSVSSNNGSSWNNYTVAPNPGELADKNHFMVDKKSGSIYENRAYCAWTDFGGSNSNDIVLRYSTNFGQTWSSSKNLSGSLNPGSHAQGVNIQTGPNGEVYAAFVIYDNWPNTEDAIGFSKSTDGGVTWTSSRVYSAASFGIRGYLSSKDDIRVSSFPSMTVDRSGGEYNGYIYITWPQIDVSPAGSDPDIVLIKSTNGGSTWSSPVRVNDDALNNGKDQYYPWCTVDQSTGQLSLVFYDSRDVPNSQAEVFMATSSDGGTSFENFKVSDQPHTPSPISGLADGYAGDYIGIAALNNTAYPYWADNRTGNYQGWMSIVTFGPPCPVEAPSNPSPADGAIGIPINISQISWTNGTGATQCEVWFGEEGILNKVYDGSLISSYNITSALNYNKIYNWKIVDKNDTCGVSGNLWTFTTELNPNIVFSETFDNLNCWTPIGPYGTTNWSIENSNNAGGTSPELDFYWNPTFNGLSKLVSCPIVVESNHNYSIEFKHALDWYTNPAPTIGIGISYNNGTSYTSVWSTTPVGDLGPETITASFTTPVGKTPQSTNLYLVFYCNGNSYNINDWFIDDLTLYDDEFSNVVDPANVTATPLSFSQISLGFDPNADNDNVIIVWNYTGTFTDPSGAPPAVGQPFAGGTLLYNGIISPYYHAGLNEQTTYYYKLFSYDNSNYSTGIEINTSTPAAPATFQLSVSIAQSWNMISIPGLHPIDQNINTWWAYRDLSANVYKYSTSGYQSVDTLIPGIGYYMKNTDARIYNTGDEWPAGGILEVPHDPITVASGWNIIGLYENNVTASSLTTSPPGLISGPIYKYDNGYQVASSLDPGYGYWVKVLGDCEIIVPDLSSNFSPEVVDYFKDDWGIISISDQKNNHCYLYAAAGKVDLSLYELPPPPPTGMFDVRFTSGRIAEDIRGSSKIIEISGANYPITIRAEKINLYIQDISGELINNVVKAGESLTINNKISTIKVSDFTIPEKYELKQNYPNPFNPNTTIEFSLPEDVTNAELTIYNTLGQKVDELVNGLLTAGNYKYKWNAKGCASGIYYYRLKTESVKQNLVFIKKMILIK